MKYEIIDRKTSQVVAVRNSLHAAIRRVDVMDEAYGGSRYFYRPVVEPIPQSTE